MTTLISAPASASQALLAGAMLLAAYLTFVGVTPPHVPKDRDNDNDKKASSKSSSATLDKKNEPEDLIKKINLTTPRGPSIVFSHIAFLASYAAFLAYSYDPDTNTLAGVGGATKAWAAPYCSLAPSSSSSTVTSNALNPSLLTWSPFTAVPLAIIILIGAPLRLIPYSALAQNFTFALAEPDRLVTTGIYSLVQHPSYTGLAALFFGNSVLYYRYDTPLVACLCPPGWMPWIRILAIAFVWPAFVFAGAFGISVRVRQEEKMLKAKFGKEWESWNTRTARFIPYVF